MKKTIVGILVSIIAIYILISKTDLSELTKLKDISYIYLLPFILFSTIGQVVFSFRWFLLLGRRVSFKNALFSYMIGAGGNMILPARGGDIFRTFYVKKESNVSLPFSFSRLFLEKVIDLISIVMIGIIAFFYLGMDRSGNVAIFTISFIIIAGMIISLVVIRFHTVWLIDMLKKVSVFFKKGTEFHNHIETHIIDLAEFLSIRSFLYPFLLTMSLWPIIYAFNYISIQHFINIDLSYPQIIFLIFCGAMGVAVPSAPSGIGVFHASIVGGFILMKKSPAEGLMYATILHLTQFILLTIIAICFYLYWSIKQRKVKSVYGNH